VNQFGAVQAVGGINEKIEGFFDICVARGLSGEQGVLIPAANVADLMLRREVVDAARAGQFHIWAVSDVDEALELLTGLTAGKADEKGEMPAGTFNARVAEGLARLAKMRRDFAATPKHTDHKPKGS
jgi:predicted ATP-dependent protease